jgi:hypothetical protein
MSILEPGTKPAPLEDWRIRRRLRRIEGRLRRHPTVDLSAALQAARARNLDHLHTYWERGIFPRNTDHHLKRIPCFIDHQGRVCAVGALIIASGHRDLAQRVDQAAHNARIKDMVVPGLGDWTAQSGLTIEELGQIQPGYDPAAFLAIANLVYIPIFILISAINVVMTRFNRSSQQRHGWRVWMPIVIGFVGAGLATFMLTGISGFAFDMVRYFFGIIQLTEVSGYSTLFQPASQSAMALPLLIFALGCILTGIFAVWAVVSGVRAMRHIGEPPHGPATIR